MRFDWLRYIVEEVSHIRRMKDVQCLASNLAFVVPRVFERPYSPRSYPLSLQLEPTNHCNISCLCCGRNGMTRPLGFMPFCLYTKIVDDAAENRVRVLFLYLHGEPFLHPEFIDMIRYAKKKNLGMVITTNCTLLDKDVIRELLRSGLTMADHLILSILGACKETHEKIMQGVVHEQVMANVMNLLEMRRQTKWNIPVIEVVPYVVPENKHEVSDYVNKWRGIVDHVRKPVDASMQFAGNNSNAKRTRTCKNIWERMTVLWNGDVTLCHADLNGTISFGNIADRSILKIWNDGELAAIRQRHRNGEFSGLPLCETCDWV